MLYFGTENGLLGNLEMLPNFQVAVRRLFYNTLKFKNLTLILKWK